MQRAVFILGYLAEENALVGPQQVNGGKNDADRCVRGPVHVVHKGACQNQELADESIQHGKPRRGQRHKQKESRDDRQRSGKAPVFANQVRVPAVIEHSDKHEKSARGYSVVQHLIQGALNRRGIERKKPEHHKSKVADRGVGNQALEVCLHHGHEGAVNNSDDGQNGDVGSETVSRFGKKRQTETQHSVRTHLQQHAGKHHGTRGGRFGVSVGEPGVQREKRHLDGKRQEKSGKKKLLGTQRENHLAAHEHVLDLRQIEGAAQLVEPDHGHEHQNRAQHRVQNEFDRGINAPFVAPDSDQEVHRDQHHFPEKEKFEQIERNKNADDAGFEYEQADEKAAHPLLDRFPGRQDGDGRQESGEQDEKQADAVNSEVIVDGRRRNPVVEFNELVIRRIQDEAPE